MAYIEQIHPPYINDRLGPAVIREDFETDQILAQNRERLILIGGANLVLRGIVEFTPDIDVLAPVEFLQMAQMKDGAEIVRPPVYARLNGADNFSVRFRTDLHRSWVTATDRLGDGHFPMSYHNLDGDLYATETVAGVRCLSLDRVAASKRALGRPKDVEHLDKITKHASGYMQGEPEKS